MLKLRNAIVFILCAVMVFALAACSHTSEETPEATATEAPAATDTQAGPEETEAPEDPEAPEATEEPYDDGTLTEREIESLETLSDMIEYVDEKDFVSTVNSWLSDPVSAEGLIYQLVGMYKRDGDQLYLADPSGEEGGPLLPLTNIVKNLAGDQLVRVTGLFIAEEQDGAAGGYLQVQAIEVIDQAEASGSRS